MRTKQSAILVSKARLFKLISPFFHLIFCHHWHLILTHFHLVFDQFPFSLFFHSETWSFSFYFHFFCRCRPFLFCLLFLLCSVTRWCQWLAEIVSSSTEFPVARHASPKPCSLQEADALSCVLAHCRLRPARRPRLFRYSRQTHQRYPGKLCLSRPSWQPQAAPSVVVRFEWQKRIFVGRRMLCNRYGRHVEFLKDDSYDALYAR